MRDIGSSGVLRIGRRLRTFRCPGRENGPNVLQHSFGSRRTSCDIGWFQPRTTGVTPVNPATASIQGSPNPFRDGSTLTFSLTRSGIVECAVFDLEGRLVRHLASAWMPAGPQSLTWNGASDSGVPAPAGVYLTRLRGPDGTQSARLVRVR
jgi:hypothetical protein